ncbi:hypothetical protein EJ05DRAFT_169625 [Pseudovirgaria hyperparasitica]|uniref:Uncharacterized protein n=1 Tax=Pseudovirgaria hyperparasitica TaxID=470096 RepID=A0A6A6VVG3_9PEZI|nr:uncharacterized protein EJ05DRAFT_169625 [Pseudovirgaria hyperparasitica]KAF2753714.1 hypothetical protein EJ05DRAFT_169625 [Pseudovirgaria hyperparasitica]
MVMDMDIDMVWYSSPALLDLHYSCYTCYSSRWLCLFAGAIIVLSSLWSGIFVPRSIYPDGFLHPRPAFVSVLRSSRHHSRCAVNQHHSCQDMDRESRATWRVFLWRMHQHQRRHEQTAVNHGRFRYSWYVADVQWCWIDPTVPDS